MGTKFRIGVFLFVCILTPRHLGAQSQGLNFTVSVRDLGIPPKARNQFQKGLELLAKKNPAASLPFFDRAAKLFGDYYEAFEKIGEAQLQLLHVADAEQAFRKSIDVSQCRYPTAFFALGALLEYKEKFADAEDVIRQGLVLDPDSWPGHFYLARAQYDMNQWEAAELSVRAALRIKPDSKEAVGLLADIHGRERNFRAMADDLEEYNKLDPDSLAGLRARELRDRALQKLGASESGASVALQVP